MSAAPPTLHAARTIPAQAVRAQTRPVHDRPAPGRAVATAGPAPVPPVLAAVLLALAGARTGDRVAAVGAGELVERSLLAASSTEVLVASDASVVVAGAAFEVPVALSCLQPTGRLVAVAADRAAAQRVAAAAGLRLRHVEPVLGKVAWSATRAAGADDRLPGRRVGPSCTEPPANT